jgi:hypothetical protein
MDERPSMDQGTRPDDGTGPDEGTEMDVQRAAAILAETTEQARRALGFRRPALLGVWGLAWVVIYGVLWLSVRGQRPYQGPTPAALLAVTIVVAASYAVTVVLVGRAASGVGGGSAVKRRILVLSYVAAYVGVLTLEAALDHAGASRAVLGVYGANAPILVIGLVVAASSTLSLTWSAFGLGIWMMAVAACSGFAGPVSVWAVDALAGGIAVLVLAAIELRRSRT